MSYAGTVQFTSTDPGFVASTPGTLTNGFGTFQPGMKQAGTQTITATDTVTSSITGTSNAITVNPGATQHLGVSLSATANPGMAFNFNVTATDLYGNVTPAYTGTVQFTSSDGTATLPANSTLTNGQGTFSATLQAKNMNETITATDTVSSSITGTGSLATLAVTLQSFDVQ
jgi:hypothetical protein